MLSNHNLIFKKGQININENQIVDLARMYCTVSTVYYNSLFP